MIISHVKAVNVQLCYLFKELHMYSFLHAFLAAFKQHQSDFLALFS